MPAQQSASSKAHLMYLIKSSRNFVPKVNCCNLLTDATQSRLRPLLAVLYVRNAIRRRPLNSISIETVQEARDNFLPLELRTLRMTLYCEGVRIVNLVHLDEVKQRTTLITLKCCLRKVAKSVQCRTSTDDNASNFTIFHLKTKRYSLYFITITNAQRVTHTPPSAASTKRPDGG